MSLDHVALIGGGDQTKRRELDFYPTPPECTEALLNFLNLPKGCTVWEPAAGNGAIVDVLAQRGHLVYASDIEPQGNYFRQDFLQTVIPEDPKVGHNVIITNPPFFLCEEFIRHAIAHAHRFDDHTVAILHKSQYWHAKKRIQLFRWCPPSYVLALTWRPDFYYQERKKGGSPTMDMVWSVWRGIDHVKMGTQGMTIYDVLDRPVMKQIDLFNDPH